MKKTILIASSLLALSNCCTKNEQQQPAAVLATVQNTSIQGVWDLVSTYSYENSQVVDTFYVPPNPRMVKIFYKTKYMWSHKPKDSLEWHAFGTYEMVGDTLIQKREYCSRPMEGHSVETKLKVILEKDTYTQIHFDPKGEAFYAENYKRIE